ncbi:lysophospholipase L1-like esterase [Haloferula luteola]|uniref:Lysophospholipase L1-like esterase n=1 Tax=Haloferula luteola TaxID=595692 RepID=A0A840VC00_9BACT|nr:rhamnogalacturonan acetylesterase [Haloferula luteola]MBB5353074.1 lysophospholipase L1-like esterase [Haloferula luteola]
MRALRFLLIFAFWTTAMADDERPIVDDRGEKRDGRTHRDLPTLWIAGDSTVKSNGAMCGWGQEIGAFFDSQKINVANHAIGGRSSRTFFTEGRWQVLLDQIQPGDFVLIQFGHNDVGPPDARSKFRGSVKGIGEETEAVEKPDGTTETVHTYGWYLREYARTAREHGATVILCSPVPHKAFDRQGDFVPDWVEWSPWVEQCAKKEKALFVDLSKLVGKKYQKWGAEKVEPLFADARTHTTPEGARLNAEILVDALKRLPGKPLRRYLR